MEGSSSESSVHLDFHIVASGAPPVVKVISFPGLKFLASRDSDFLLVKSWKIEGQPFHMASDTSSSGLHACAQVFPLFNTVISFPPKSAETDLTEESRT